LPWSFFVSLGDLWNRCQLLRHDFFLVLRLHDRLGHSRPLRLLFFGRRIFDGACVGTRRLGRWHNQRALPAFRCSTFLAHPTLLRWPDRLLRFGLLLNRGGFFGLALALLAWRRLAAWHLLGVKTSCSEGFHQLLPFLLHALRVTAAIFVRLRLEQRELVDRLFRRLRVAWLRRCLLRLIAPVRVHIGLGKLFDC
jgi:hypothetical protein